MSDLIANPAEQPMDRDITQRIAERSERIHINLGPVCNNNCVFCMEEDREERYRVNSALNEDRVRGILEANAGAEEVCFTSGEPTLVEALPTYVEWAKDLGFSRRSVMTNGRRLSYMSYAVSLVKAGMNYFYVSIHGHQEKLHNALVRTKGAFDQTVAGLDNITRLKPYGVGLHTSTVLTLRNLPHLGEIYAFLREHGVDQVVFNVMQPNGRADTHFDRLFPRYTDIAAHMERFVSQCDEAEPQAFLVDIPLCVTEGVPDFNRGYVERLVHFELPDPDGAEKKGDAGSLLSGARTGADGAMREITREDLDNALRSKRAECSTCRYQGICEGVWNNYLERFGWDEFEPVQPL